MPDHTSYIAAESPKWSHKVTTSNALEDDRRPLTGAYDYQGAQLDRSHRRRNSSRQLLVSWLPELLASLLSIALLIALIVILRIFEGRPLTNLGLPPYLTLNGIIAAIATVNRACLIAPICTALMQEMWISYLNEGKKSKCRNRLGDMDLFSEASMGAWGCVALLISKRRPIGLMAIAGCLITILSLAYSTFVQQLVGIELLPLYDDYGIGNLPRTETWDQQIGHGTSKPYPPLEMVAAIYDGILTKEIEPLQANCPSGNCTWPDTTSMAVCGACENSTYHTAYCDPTRCVECGADYTSSCNYTLPSGSRTQLMNLDADSSQWASGGKVARFKAVPGQGHVYNSSSGDRLYLMNVELFGTPFGTVNGVDSELELVNVECALWMCVQTYHTEMKSTVQFETVTSTHDTIDRDDTSEAYYPSNDPFLHFLPVANQTGQHRGTNFTASIKASRSLSDFLRTSINGTISTQLEILDYSSNFMLGIWQGSQDPEAWIANFARSMTNVVRSFNQTSRDQYDGMPYELAVDVRWVWLVFPVAVVCASIAFLLAVMIRTAVHGEAENWKGSPLAFLLFALQPDAKDACLRRLGEDGWRSAQKELAGYRVRVGVDAKSGGKIHVV
ncbi:hypothetical protein Q7P37_004668 [Cladosporium fusiforme]